MQRIGSSIRTNWCEAGEHPAATVDSGEIFEVESTSFSEGYTFDTMPALTLEQAVAPLTAPILVNGALAGDAIRVDILDLKFTRDFGCILLLPGRGAFPEVTGSLVAHPVRIDDTWVYFSPSISIPTHKMLGKVSVAPSGPRILSNEPGIHGGNMDNRDLGIGASVILPVFVDGAHLGIGDAHAVQADGECGISAVEVEMTSLLRVTVLKGADVRMPIIQSDGKTTVMGVGESLDKAADQALREMSRLLQHSRGISPQESAMLMSLACDVHVAQLVNPKVGVKASVPSSLLPAAGGKS